MDENNSIQLFEDRKIRTAWDEEKEEWYFSVVDVIAVLTDQPTARNASTYWAVLKKRLKEEGASELLTNCKQLKMRATDGKMRLTDVASTEQLLRIIRHTKQSPSSVGWHRSAGSASRRPSTRSRPSTGRWRPIRRRAMTPTGSTSASSLSASATSSPPNGRRGAWSRAGNTPSSPTRSQRPGPA